jgi:hypothetical protein
LVLPSVNRTAGLPFTVAIAGIAIGPPERSSDHAWRPVPRSTPMTACVPTVTT